MKRACPSTKGSGFSLIEKIRSGQKNIRHNKEWKNEVGEVKRQ